MLLLVSSATTILFLPARRGPTRVFRDTAFESRRVRVESTRVRANEYGTDLFYNLRHSKQNDGEGPRATTGCETHTQTDRHTDRQTDRQTDMKFISLSLDRSIKLFDLLAGNRTLALNRSLARSIDRSLTKQQQQQQEWAFGEISGVVTKRHPP